MTLSRFFVIHVMVLPAALIALAGLHLFLFRCAGPAGPFRGTPTELKAKTDYFFPTADLEGRGRDGGGLCLHQCDGLLGAGGLVGRGDA